MVTNQSTCLTGDVPVVLRNDNVCNLGFYCPNNSVVHPPEYCPPTVACHITRLQTTGNICTEPQGAYEPTACRPGHYCPPGGVEQFPCPAKHYCPLAAFEPIACETISSCPPGSSRQIELTGLFLLLLCDTILLALVIPPVIRRCWPERCSQAQAVVDESVKFSLGGWMKAGMALLLPGNDRTVACGNDMQRFIASITKCIGGADVGLEITFEGLGFDVGPAKKKILDGISGTIERGSLVAIMGASGAGKSTLVRVLMGKLKHTSGSIQVNGQPRAMSDFKSIIGYVPQDDVVLAELTVRENIRHAARVRLPRVWTAREIEQHVDVVISCLQLTHVQHSLVGDIIKPVISGGQRKRVSIGIELAAAPMMLVLDEPTSGLDATSALSVIEILKALTRMGVTVICTVHQPRVEIFNALDHVLLLANGREVFLDRAARAIEYFESMNYAFPSRCNPADVIMDIISDHTHEYTTNSTPDLGAKVNMLAANWQMHQQRCSRHHNHNHHTAMQDPQVLPLRKAYSRNSAPWHRQMYLCFVRSLTQQSRQLTGFILEIAVGAIAGLLIGLSVYKLDGLLFQGVYLPPFQLLSSAVNYTLVPELGLLCSLAIGLAAAAPGVKTFGEEKAVYWREASSGHSRSAYFVGKVLSTLFRLSLSALHFTVFYSILAAPRMAFSFLYVANLLYFYCIYGLAACVSTIVRREDGPLLAMIVSLIIGVFGGYGPSLATIKSWHLVWFWRICPGTWLSEAYFDAHTVSLRYLYDIDAAAAWMGYTVHQLGLDLGILFVIGSVYRLMAFVGLVRMNRDKQI